MTRDQFERLAADTHPIILCRLRSRFKDGYLADDVATTVITDAWQIWNSNHAVFDNGNFVNWASQRARWRALDDLRKRPKTAALAEEHQGAIEEATLAPDAPAIAPAASPEREEFRRLVWDAVCSLSAGDRFVLEGMAYDRLTDQVMGAALFGEEDSTSQARGLRVFRRRQQALVRLRERLIEWGFDEAAWRAGQAV